jgi:hypothetical protein
MGSHRSALTCAYLGTGLDTRPNVYSTVNLKLHESYSERRIVLLVGHAHDTSGKAGRTISVAIRCLRETPNTRSRLRKRKISSR